MAVDYGFSDLFSNGLGTDNSSIGNGADLFNIIGNDALWSDFDQMVANGASNEDLYNSALNVFGNANQSYSDPFNLNSAFSSALGGSSWDSLINALGNVGAAAISGGNGSSGSNGGTGSSAGGTTGGFSSGMTGNSTLDSLLTLGILGGSLFDSGDKTTTDVSRTYQYPDWWTNAAQSLLGLTLPESISAPNTTVPLSQYINQAGGALGSLGSTISGMNTFAAGPKTIADSNLDQYMNPYIDAVLAPQLKRLNEEEAATLAELNAKSGMHNAFGGSRSQLMQDLANQRYNLARDEAEANARSDAFNTALKSAGTDAASRLGVYSAIPGLYNNLASGYGNLGTTEQNLGVQNAQNALSAWEKESAYPLDRLKALGSVLGSVTPTPSYTGTTEGSDKGSTFQNLLSTVGVLANLPGSSGNNSALGSTWDWLSGIFGNSGTSGSSTSTTPSTSTGNWWDNLFNTNSSNTGTGALSGTEWSYL